MGDNTRIGPETRERIKAAWPVILTDIESGSQIGKALEKHGIKRSHIDAYLIADPAATREWNAAKECSADAYMDQALEIAEHPGSVITHDADGKELVQPVVVPADWQHARLRIDTLKWAAKVRNPRQYSDKSSIDLNVKTVDLTAIIRDANARLAAAQAVGRVIEHQAADAALLTADTGSIEDLM